MLYEQKSISPIFFMSNVLEYYVNNPPGFDENEIDKKEGEIFTDVYYPQDPNILEGRYKVSNMGRVYDTYNKSFLTNYSDKGGYEYVNLASVNSNNKVEIYRYRLNRIVLSSFDPNDNMCNLHVHHINNISCDNRVENLDWATPKENSNYAKQDGRFSLISDESKITINLADNICNYIKNGHTPEEAGVKYNVNDTEYQTEISGIKNKNIDKELNVYYSINNPNEIKANLKINENIEIFITISVLVCIAFILRIIDKLVHKELYL